MKAKMMNIAIPVEVLEESGLDLSAVLELEAGRAPSSSATRRGWKASCATGSAKTARLWWTTVTGTVTIAPVSRPVTRVNGEGIDE